MSVKLLAPCCGNCAHAPEWTRDSKGKQFNKCRRVKERGAEFGDGRGDWRPAEGWCPLHEGQGTA